MVHHGIHRHRVKRAHSARICLLQPIQGKKDKRVVVYLERGMGITSSGHSKITSGSDREEDAKVDDRMNKRSSQIPPPRTSMPPPTHTGIPAVPSLDRVDESSTGWSSGPVTPGFF